MIRSLAAASLATLLVASVASAQSIRLFRPLLADPRENQFRMKWVTSTEDWRYGTDVTDSLSSGGHLVRKGVTWDVGFGETFRTDPWRRLFGMRAWERYQVGIPAGVFANFDRKGAVLVNADYQFGLSFDFLLHGATNERHDIDGFRRAAWTLRTMVYHRSTHLGDEYLAQGAFGRNALGLEDAGQSFGRPPVRRYNLSFESSRVVLSVEKAPGGPLGDMTVRPYGGFEKKFGRLFTHEPGNFSSAIYQFGLELRQHGDAASVPENWLAHVQNWIYPHEHEVVCEWVGALDLKLARPYEFALADAPPGATAEAWTPHLWSEGHGGREFARYAGSWHAMIGAAIYRRSDRNHDGKGVAASFIPQQGVLALDWYHGYSPNGQFLDQRLRYGPWSPSLTLYF